MDEIDWERFSDPTIISARTLILIVGSIALVLQSVALMIQPTEWWTWQLLSFITATNLGAVVLAVLAQNSANDIGKAYKTVFTPSFYKTVNLDEEIHEIAPKMWSLVRANLDVQENIPSLTPMAKEQDDDLFE